MKNICWIDININNLKGGGVVTLPFVPVFNIVFIISRNIIYLNNTIGQFQGMF